MVSPDEAVVSPHLRNGTSCLGPVPHRAGRSGCLLEILLAGPRDGSCSLEQDVPRRSKTRCQGAHDRDDLCLISVPYPR